MKRMIPLEVRNQLRLIFGFHPIEYRMRWPDVEMIRLGTSDIVIDVGANRGDFTECVLAYQPWAAIHAFEPLPEAFSYAEKKFANYKKVKFNNIALGNINGVKRMNVSSYDQVSSSVMIKSAPFSYKTRYC